MKRCMVWSVVLMVVLSLTTVFAENQKKEKGGKLKGKKIVMIIAKQMFEESEFKYPKEIFDNEGADVTIASSTLSMATGGSLRVKPDILIDDIKVKDFDAIVFIGGFGVTEYFENPQAHRIARQALEADKILAAICMAPRILANAGVLKGKKATCFPSVREDIKAKGAIVTGEMVERDGNIITGNGPGAATKFAETIVSALSEK
jgi:protease I